MSKLFISYRRQDSRDVTTHLHHRLKARFGPDSVFLDVDTILPGVDFRKALDDAVKQCDILLAVISDRWLDAAYQDGPRQNTRRLDDPDDYVRIEIGAALARSIPVAPILVGTGGMPGKAELPDALRELAFRQAVTLRSGPDFEGQLERLMRGLERLLAQKRELGEGVQRVVRTAGEDPKMALGRARVLLELMVRDIYERRTGEPPGPRSLESLVQRLDTEGWLPDQFDVTALVQRLSDAGTAHWGEKITSEEARHSVAQLSDILKWYLEVEQPDALAEPPHERRKPEAASKAPAPKPPPREPKSAVAIVPKGLRSFDDHDARFFLELLPGPRDEDGLPESIRFWKHRIESGDELTFTVGVIYGPSGCGKSSLVKAGVLPSLANEVVTVYVEATAAETEPRLQSALRRRCPRLPADLDLTGTITAIRQGRGLAAGQHLLVVLDQFEQWLHGRRPGQDAELARALRQCDGERVQCILTVREDFWVALSRFMDELHLEILQGQNATLVDLFDPIHARKVLAEFGKAYGRLPHDAALTRDQESFLDLVIDGLSRDGRIIPIRLSVFAEMVKGRPWVAATLKDVGGTEGIGVAFLEETFNTAALKNHQKAAQGILKSLLPESGSNIKGHMRSRDDLAAAAGYAPASRELDNLLRALDHDVRLITPTDPEGTDPAGAERLASVGRYYQLTHDYLVPSVRDWLTRKQRETRRGRAELRLAERAALWNEKPENRHLPSVLEWANIRLLTKKRQWSTPQGRMMRRAGLVHGLRALGLAIVSALAAWGAIEGYGNLEATALVDSLAKAPTVKADISPILKQLAGSRRWAVPRLKRMLRESDPQTRAHLHASLALLEVDPSRVDFIFGRMLKADPDEIQVLRDALKSHQSRLAPKLWSVLASVEQGDARLLPAAGALALYDAQSSQWAESGGKVARALVTLNPVHLGPWLVVLRDVHGRLSAPLAAIFNEPNTSESDRGQAASILADYAADEPALLADLLMAAEPRSFAKLFPVMGGQPEHALSVFRAELAKRLSAAEAQSEAAKDDLAEHQARAAIALLRLGHGEEVWSLLQHSPDPRLRSFKINWLNPLGADPRHVVAQLGRLQSPPRPAQRGETERPDSIGGGRSPGEGSASAESAERGDGASKVARRSAAGPQAAQPEEGSGSPGPHSMDAILFDPNTSIRRALILALGTYARDAFSPAERESLVTKLLDLYKNDPDAGIHGAAEWTLRRWNQQETINTADVELSKLKDAGQRRWFINGQGQTFVVIDGPVEFRMGSPPGEPDRNPDELPHRRLIPRRSAIAAKEVSVEQYQKFLRDYRQFSLDQSYLDKYSPSADGPMIGFSWFISAGYCNWLSKQEGLPPEQWCYIPKEGGEYAAGMTIPADVLKRKGYRLPTEAEWEYACRAGTLTCRYYGLSLKLLANYAWYAGGSQDRAWPRGLKIPNDLGLFDTLGNVYEWCQDRYGRFQPGRDGAIMDAIVTSESIDIQIYRLLRGGAFSHRPGFARSAYRYGLAPSFRGIFFGLRPARTYD
jgi:formylglycine-generating enzyme required for sulfatase activity